MKIGIGKHMQRGVLFAHGAERVLTIPEEADCIRDHAGMTIRAGDVILLPHPAAISVGMIRHLSTACGGQLEFEVIGHPPRALKSPEEIAEFRQLRAKDLATEVEQVTGRPREIKYTVEQAEAIIRLWHSEEPYLKPAAICGMVDALLGLPEGTVPKHWVRDLVIKFVGTARRKAPPGWRGIQRD